MKADFTAMKDQSVWQALWSALRFYVIETFIEIRQWQLNNKDWHKQFYSLVSYLIVSASLFWLKNFGVGWTCPLSIPPYRYLFQCLILQSTYQPIESDHKEDKFFTMRFNFVSLNQLTKLLVFKIRKITLFFMVLKNWLQNVFICYIAITRADF